MGERIIDQYPRSQKKLNPYLVIFIGLPILVFTAMAAYYVNSYIQWLNQGHWNTLSPVLWVIGSAVGMSILAALATVAWKVYRAIDLHLEEKKDRDLKRQRELAAIHALNQAAAGQVTYKMSQHGLEVRTMRRVPAERQLQTTIQEVENEETDEQEELLQLPSPRVIRYEDIKDQIPAGHAVLGVYPDGRIKTCDFGRLMTCWICGNSSTGKSNTVALKVNEAIHLGRKPQIILIDQHARKEDSLYNKIKCYENYFLFPVARTEEEVLDRLQWFYQEFKRRLETDPPYDCDIFLIVDEVKRVMDTENEHICKLLKKIAEICGQEARGFGMFGWFISQQAAGLSWLRNVALTVIAHKMVMWSERLLACNQDSTICRAMDTWPVGRTVVYGVALEEVMVLQQPLFQPPLVLKATAEPKARTFQQLPLLEEEDGEVDELPAKPKEPNTIIDINAHNTSQRVRTSRDVGAETRAIILRMYRARSNGKPGYGEIAKLVGLSGRKYPIFQQVCQELGIPLPSQASDQQQDAVGGDA